MKVSQMHPFSARIVKTGTAVVRVDFGHFSRTKMAKLEEKIGDLPYIHRVDTELCDVYVTSRKAADALAKKYGAKVSGEGRIDDSGLSNQFVERVDKNEWK